MTINGKKVNATEFAYDDCHKIYIIESEEDRDMMIGYGYSIIGIKQLKAIWNNSCPLRFIESADLTTVYTPQFEAAVFTVA